MPLALAEYGLGHAILQQADNVREVSRMMHDWHDKALTGVGNLSVNEAGAYIILAIAPVCHLPVLAFNRRYGLMNLLRLFRKLCILRPLCDMYVLI